MPEESLESSFGAENTLALEANRAPLGTPENELVLPAPENQEKSTESAGGYERLLQKVSAVNPLPGVTGSEIEMDASAAQALQDEEEKVQHLIELAATKGVVHAVQVAKKMSDYYALDRMHDEMTGKLYEGLVARGLVTKE